MRGPICFIPPSERWDQELMALSISIIRNKPDIDSPINFVVARSLIVIKTNKVAERSVDKCNGDMPPSCELKNRARGRARFFD